MIVLPIPSPIERLEKAVVNICFIARVDLKSFTRPYLNTPTD